MQNIMVQAISIATYIQLASSFCVFIDICFIYDLQEPLLVWCCHLAELLEKILMKDTRSSHPFSIEG